MNQTEIIKSVLSDFNLMGSLGIAYKIELTFNGKSIIYSSYEVKLELIGDYLKAFPADCGENMIYEFVKINNLERLYLESDFNGMCDNINVIREEHEGQLLIYEVKEVNGEKEFN